MDDPGLTSLRMRWVSAGCVVLERWQDSARQARKG